MTTSTALDAREISPRIGTEIRAEKAALPSGDHAGTLRELLEQRGVLVFPQIEFTDEEQRGPTTRTPAGCSTAPSSRVRSRSLERG